MATSAEIDKLFQQTLEGDYDDEEDEGGPWEAVSKLQAIASREVFDKAVQWSRNKQPAKRRRGVDILAQLGKTEDHPDVVFAAESYFIIANVLEDELDLQVIDSCLVAFGHLGNPAAVPLILEHRANSDPDVRFAVAFALSCFADEPAAIRVLLELMDDSDPDIRDWATFGLGVQGNADTPEIRKALIERLDDGNPDTIQYGDKAFINLQKRQQTSAVIREVHQFQQTPYNFKDWSQLIKYLLRNTHLLDDSQLYKQSLKVEPRAKA